VSITPPPEHESDKRYDLDLARSTIFDEEVRIPKICINSQNRKKIENIDLIEAKSPKGIPTLE
jgi:hypothetical protein